MYYHKERAEWFPEAFQKKMTVDEAKIVFRKLCKHFKLDGFYNKVNLYWTSGSRRPKAFGNGAVLLNADWNNFGVLCHEISHIKEKKKYGDSGHTKRHRKVMKTVINYCKRKNWFEEELKRRTAPKPAKPEPSKDELRAMKIARLEKCIRKNQSRIKRLQTAVKKANRRIACLKRFKRAE